MNIRALCAEFVGTFMLVASVLGAALFSFPIAGIVGVALSIGFTVMAMIFLESFLFHPKVIAIQSRSTGKRLENIKSTPWEKQWSTTDTTNCS